MMHITILGNPITKKNSQRIVKGRNGQPFLIPSKQYVSYEKLAISQIPFMDAIDYPVNVQAVYYMKTKRRVDLVNLLEATCDILVKAGILADDNCNIVASHDGSRVMHDKDKPRCEIFIEPALLE